MREPPSPHRPVRGFAVRWVLIAIVSAGSILAFIRFAQDIRAANVDKAIPSHLQNQVWHAGPIVGDVPSEVTHRYLFTNTSDADLTLVDFERTCSCTDIQTPKKTFAPGEQGYVEATMSLVAAGPRSTVVTLIWSTGARTFITISALAVVPSELKVSPQIVNLQSADETIEFRLTFVQLDPESDLPAPSITWVKNASDRNRSLQNSADNPPEDYAAGDGGIMGIAVTSPWELVAQGDPTVYVPSRFTATVTLQVSAALTTAKIVRLQVGETLGPEILIWPYKP